MALVKIYKQGSGGGGATTLVVGSTSITGGAVGRVLFEGASNVLQESSKLFWDNTNGRLGIGENTPLGILHLKEEGQTTRFLIDGDAGQSKIITYRTKGLQRFGLYVNNIAESGSNAGSDFAIRAYSDLGVLLSTPLYIKRSSGNVLINTTTDSGFKLDVVGGDARFNSVKVGRGGGNSATNTVLGDSALTTNSTGVNNTALGQNTLFSNTSSNNTAVGFSALNFNTTGGTNTAIGSTSLLNLNSGSSNTALGRNSGRYIADASTSLTIATQSIFIGAESRPLANSQTNQIVIGYDAIGLGSNSVVLGNSSITLTALRGNVLIGTTTDSGFKLDVVGGDARFNSVRVGLGGNGSDTLSTAVGASALNANTSGIANTAIGYSTLSLNISGSNNTAVGYLALSSTTVSGSNTAIGSTSLLNLNSGQNNTALGRNSARYIADGSTSLTIANQSVFIGSESKALANSQTNQIVIGYNAIGAGSNTATLGNTSIVDTILRGRVNIQQYATGSRPTYVKGALIYDSTLGKLVVGGNADWEVVTSV